MKRNFSATRSGPGRVHKEGYKKPRKKIRGVPFGDAITLWITATNLKNIRLKKEKQQNG